jgi:predicted DNA-binding transcriptional regulator AlpA
MVLAIDVPPAAASKPSKARRYRSRHKSERDLGIDPVVYMRDVVRIVGRHRSTILRWIDRKTFPPKSVPRAHPSGWLRSEIESWQRGVVSSVDGQSHVSGGCSGGVSSPPRSKE